MKNRILTLLLLSLTATAWSQKAVPVFTSGTDGHRSYRIPAVISLPNNDILAFCEGRVHGSGDFGDINIVMKRSSDGGKTWSAIQVVAEFDTLQAGNPAPVVDLTDPQYPQGRIFLFYNTGNNHEGEVRKGNGYKQVWYKSSADNGHSWSEATEITNQTHRPNKPGINPAWNFKEDWRTYAITPGHAMQFQSGKYRGRIFVAANHSAGDPKRDWSDYAAHGFYTDDHGKSFKISEDVNIPGSNESIATELSNDKLMMNSRNQKGDIRARIVSISSDGGATWDTSYFDRTLIDPVNQGSLITVGQKKGKKILAFSNAADLKRRDNLTVRISYNDGKTWKKSILIDNSGDENKQDYTAYSDLVQTGKKHLGILYERNGYKEIVFSVIKWR